MNPPIFTLALASAAVTDLIGAGVDCRLYPFGEAPPEVELPYVVWQLVGGQPENYLGEAPDVDSLQVQVDIYAEASAVARAVTKALVGALEVSAYITRWGRTGRDPVTRHYRVSFDAEFITER